MSRGRVRQSVRGVVASDFVGVGEGRISRYLVELGRLVGLLGRVVFGASCFGMMASARAVAVVDRLEVVVAVSEDWRMASMMEVVWRCMRC